VPRLSIALSQISGALITSVLIADLAVAAPGDLDPSFGGNGKVRTNFTPLLDEAQGVAIQADGKIVAVGFSDGRFAVARYNVDGTLDDSFSGNGKIRTDITPGPDDARAVAIQKDGAIVAAGIGDVGGEGLFALARYTTDGTLDDSFGGDGTVETDFTSLIDGARGVAIQEDGKIVAAGFGGSSPVIHGGFFALARYTTDGTLDDTFGGDGKVTTNFSSDIDSAADVEIQANGKIVAAGSATGPYPGFALARYLEDGALDDSFSGNGKVRTRFSGGASDARGLAIQENRRIVAVGAADEPDFAFALARYRRDGSLDTSFGGDGRVRTAFSPLIDLAYDVAIQADDRIVAVGLAEGSPFDPTFALARYLRNGALDDSFGGDGKVRTNFTEGLDEAKGLAIQANGRIVAAGLADGTESPGADPTFALARYRA
jgi:uncharacterized delta-60 repeat protein